MNPKWTKFKTLKKNICIIIMIELASKTILCMISAQSYFILTQTTDPRPSTLPQIKELSFAPADLCTHMQEHTHTKRLETLFKRLFSRSLSSFVSYPVCFSYPLINSSSGIVSLCLHFAPRRFVIGMQIGLSDAKIFLSLFDLVFACLFSLFS